MPVYKDKEKETWFCKFYYVDWTGCKKQKKKEGFKRKKDALEFERSFMWFFLFKLMGPFLI